ncbi:MAG: hydantoinase/oxoprolinase family protein [Halobacteriales archaeon]|nr:hydantoinase/oxoprolinase family protein [Halobacteriales archaeon]
MSPTRLAVDIGGTFVDAVAFDDDGHRRTAKVPATPADPADGVIEAIDAIGGDLAATRTFVHGTTRGVNALIERSGARTGIITTDGFRDVFEIGRTDLPASAMYDITYSKPEPLVPRRRRIGVPGRIDADGEIIEDLDPSAVREAATSLVESADVDAIAICFLHAHQNPVHEHRARDLIADAYPDVSLSLSTDITREYREYERTATTVLDAYIKPLMTSYLRRLDAAITSRGFDGAFFLTRSGGGTLAATEAGQTPIHTILSGPAGGLIGAGQLAETLDRTQVIAIDMGGTSLDSCVITDYAPAIAHESTIEEFPVLIPVYDIRTIGAGGGSIASVEGELLKVGPESAGADPGPACYDRGGTEPTVTDAALALGYLDPNRFLGGEFALDPEATRAAISTTIADPLGTSLQDASVGIFEVTLANTVGTLREITVERGLDPREFTLLAYGGAGPTFGPLLARELDLDDVVIPHTPATFSAWGMSVADVIEDFARTKIRTLDAVDVADLDTWFDQLEADADTALADQDIPPEDRRTTRHIEMRYRGQEHTVQVPANDIDTIETLRERFEQRHADRYGHRMDDPVQTVHIRVRGIGERSTPALPQPTPAEGPPTPVDTTAAYCFARQSRCDFDVYRREDLAPAHELTGPAIVREPSATLVVHSDQRIEVDPYGHLVVE